MKIVAALHLTVLFCAFCISPVSADEDIFADYKKDMQKSAEARATSVHKAWGNNMANLIEHGTRRGVVINGAGDYAGGKIHADGVGNVTVDPGANVGHIINKTDLKNSHIIIRNKY